MKQAGAQKYLDAEQADAERIRAKVKKSKEVPVDQSAPEAKGNVAPGEILEAETEAVPHEPLSAEEGIDIEDTSFLMPEPAGEDMHAEHDGVGGNEGEAHDVSLDAMQEDAADSDMIVNEFVDMVALMDTLQVLGVDVLAANRFVTAILRERASVLEVYGRGGS